MYRSSPFSRLTKRAAFLLGHPTTFMLAVLFVLLWAITGPLFHFSDTWQLVINTSTSVVTFLMVFILQNTQNRDTEAIQVRIDELICAVERTDKGVLDIEELTEQDIQHIKERYTQLAQASREGQRRRWQERDPFEE